MMECHTCWQGLSGQNNPRNASSPKPELPEQAWDRQHLLLKRGWTTGRSPRSSIRLIWRPGLSCRVNTRDHQLQPACALMVRGSASMCFLEFLTTVNNKIYASSPYCVWQCGHCRTHRHSRCHINDLLSSFNSLGGFLLQNTTSILSSVSSPIYVFLLTTEYWFHSYSFHGNLALIPTWVQAIFLRINNLWSSLLQARCLMYI